MWESSFRENYFRFYAQHRLVNAVVVVKPLTVTHCFLSSSLFLPLPPTQPPEHATPFQLNSILPKELAKLREEKAERMKEVDALIDRDREWAAKLGEMPFAIRPNVIPSRDTLKQLEAHIEQLKQTVKDRKEEFKVLKRKIVELLDSVGVTPDNTFQGDILAEDAESFDLTTKNMDGLRRYCQVCVCV